LHTRGQSCAIAVTAPILRDAKFSYSSHMRQLFNLLLSICLVTTLTIAPSCAEKLIGAPVSLVPSPFARCPENKQAAKYFREAQKLGREGDIEGSIAYYSQALVLDPQNSSIYEARGTSLLIRRRYEQAIDDFDKSISIDKSNYLSYSGRGSAKQFRNDRTGALQDLNIAIRLCTKDSSLYTSRSDVRFELGDNAGALEDANKAICLDPNNGWVYYRRSRLLAQTGDRTGALRDLSKASSLNSRFKSNPVPRYIYGN
jgi:tetratricopeptide (TPR) repeat protein